MSDQLSATVAGFAIPAGLVEAAKTYTGGMNSPRIAKKLGQSQLIVTPLSVKQKEVRPQGKPSFMAAFFSVKGRMPTGTDVTFDLRVSAQMLNDDNTLKPIKEIVLEADSFTPEGGTSPIYFLVQSDIRLN